MKIAYVYYIRFISEVAGVVKKIQHQKKAAYTLKLGIDFFLLSEEDGSEIASVENGIKFIPTPKISNPLLRHYLLTKQILETFNHSYDVVILRHIGFTPFGTYNFRNKKFKLITEHHTKEIDEILLTNNIGKAILDVISVRANFANIDGIIAVTDEIRQYQIKRGFRKADFSIAISNGIDVNSVNLTKFQPFDGKTLNLVIVMSHLANWYGIDRVIRGITSYKGTVEFKLNIVGYKPSHDLNESLFEQKSVKFHGFLDGKDLDNLMQEMNLAIGSLAVHRKGLKEASALKVREYTARGLPFIYACDDIDLTNNLPFCKKLPANDEPIDMNMLVNFCRELSNNYIRNELSITMRNYALNNMDWKSKMKAYIDFAEKIYIG